MTVRQTIEGAKAAHVDVSPPKVGGVRMIPMTEFSARRTAKTVACLLCDLDYPTSNLRTNVGRTKVRGK